MKIQTKCIYWVLIQGFALIYPITLVSCGSMEPANPLIKETGRHDSSGRKQGLWEGVYPNHVKNYSGAYNDDRKQGEWKYFDEKGNVTTVEHYEGGKLNGDVSSFVNGRLYDRISYRNGKREGMHNHYTPNGFINYTQEYRNDSMNGKFEIYNAEGVMQQQGWLWNARNVGEWRNYNKTGVLEEILVFDSFRLDQYRMIKIGPDQDTLSDNYIRR